MARTKARVRQDHLTKKQTADAAVRSARRHIGIRRAATILSAEEAAALRVKDQCTRAAGTDKDSEDEAQEHEQRASALASAASPGLPQWVWDIFDPPITVNAASEVSAPQQVIKLSATRSPPHATSY